MEPKPLFGDTPLQADKGCSCEPRPLSFPSAAPSKPLNSTTVKPVKEPGALSFPTGSKSNQPAPAVAPQASGPKPLAFSATSAPARTAPVVARAALETRQHGAFPGCISAAKTLNASLYASEEARINRYFNQLLPVTVDSLHDFGTKVLTTSQELTAKCTTLTLEFSNLRASEIMAQAVRLSAPKLGLIEKLRAKITPAESLRPQLELLRSELSRLAEEAKDIQPKTLDSARRLALHLLALRSVEQVSGGGENLIMDMMHRRIALFRAAATQSQLAEAQLTQLQSTLLTLETECQHLLSVTLSSMNLSGALAGQPRRT